MRFSTRFGHWTVCVVFALCAASSAGAGGERIEVFADDGFFGSSFGHSCALDGGLALVGAYHDNENGVMAGAAYVYDAATGQQLRKLLTSDGFAADDFGISVALEGALAVIGAPKDDDAGEESGSAYVFDVTTGQELLKLLPSDGAAADHFGYSVGLSGNVAIIGSPDDDDFGEKSGAIYLFDVTTGQELMKLTSADAAEFDRFGAAVAIDGTTAVVGAYIDDDNGSGSGSAYVFDTTTGQQVAKLVASDGEPYDLFGVSIALSGTRALVGAQWDDDNGADSGSAYLFDTTTGQQLAKLLPAGGGAGDTFGYSVAIDGTAAIVGAYWANPLGSDSGAAYRFNAATGLLVDVMTASDGTSNDRFGESVAVDGEVALLGATMGVNDANEPAGSAYLFQVGFGAKFCEASDGALAACPCANLGTPDTGCNNAQATGGVAIDVVEQTVAPETAIVAGTGFPVAAQPTVIVLRSSALEPSPVVFGDGVRCVDDGTLVRLAATTASGGTSTHTFGHGAGTGTFYYQLWYRNGPAGFCDPLAAYNLSNGVSLAW